jgi:hypothetical protein
MVETRRAERTRDWNAERFNSVERAYHNAIKSARERNMDFSLSADDVIALVTSVCDYCGYTDEGHVNGIDRVDNNVGYLKSNCVPCCARCNYVKHGKTRDEYVTKCKLIAAHRGLLTVNWTQPVDIWTRYGFGGQLYTTYDRFKLQATFPERREDIKVLLTKREYEFLVRGQCYLCGHRAREGSWNGLDRVVNEVREYSIASCQPCCWSCNRMKHVYDLVDFLEHVSRVANYVKSAPSSKVLSEYDVVEQWWEAVRNKEVEESFEPLVYYKAKTLIRKIRTRQYGYLWCIVHADGQPRRYAHDMYEIIKRIEGGSFDDEAATKAITIALHEAAREKCARK